MAFTIHKGYLEEMIAHAKAEFPNEACGIVAGCDGRPVRLYATANSERSPVRYVIEAREQLEIMREMDDQGWDILGIFHSHTHSPAYPSQTDVQLAYYPDALYFIVSLMREPAVVRAYHIKDGTITEVALELTDAGAGGNGIDVMPKKHRGRAPK